MTVHNVFLKLIKGIHFSYKNNISVQPQMVEVIARIARCTVFRKGGLLCERFWYQININPENFRKAQIQRMSSFSCLLMNLKHLLPLSLMWVCLLWRVAGLIVEKTRQAFCLF